MNYNDDKTMVDVYHDITRNAGQQVITIARDAIGHPQQQQIFQPRFMRHEQKATRLKIFLICLAVFAVMFLVAIADSNWQLINDIKPFCLVVSIIGFIGCIGYIVLCVKNKNEDDKYFTLTIYFDNYERKYLNAENKLINLIEQSPGIPDRFRDGFVFISCDDIDELQATFTIKIKEVVGAIEFLEQNKDKWAAAFGDRDGADLKTLGTGYYQLTFDTAGNFGDRAEVSW